MSCYLFSLFIRNDYRLALVFSNRIQQVSYDNFITVISAFCLQ